MTSITSPHKILGKFSLAASTALRPVYTGAKNAAIECKGPPTEWYGPRRPHRVPGPQIYTLTTGYTDLTATFAKKLILTTEKRASIHVVEQVIM